MEKNEKSRQVSSLEWIENEVQTFSFDKTEKVSFQGKNGTQIIIDLKDLTGNKVISGPITFELVEYYSVADMVLSNLSTTSDGKLLETGGMINIKAYSDGNELALKEGKELEIEFPTLENEKMQLFYGRMEDDKMNWVPKTEKLEISKAGMSFPQSSFDESPESPYDSITNAVLNSLIGSDTKWSVGDSSVSDSDAVAQRTVLKSSKLGWINCDRFLDFNSLTTIKINYAESYNPVAFLVFKEINSIMPANYLDIGRTFINIPIDYEVTLIAFQIIDDKAFLSIEDLTVKKI